MIVPAQHRGAGERLLASAKIKAVWSTAPSADAIRARDEENLVREIVAMADAPAEEDLAAARVLLAERQRRTTRCRACPHSPRTAARTPKRWIDSRHIQEASAAKEKKFWDKEKFWT